MRGQSHTNTHNTRAHTHKCTCDTKPQDKKESVEELIRQEGRGKERTVRWDERASPDWKEQTGEKEPLPWREGST